MDFDQFAQMFGGKLQTGDIIEVHYSRPDVDGQKTKAVYYYLGWARGEVGRALSVSETFKENNHSPSRLALDSIENLFLCKKVE